MTTTQCIFPAELIYNILSHTDPRDIVRWRTVSKWFCSITNDTVLWKILYANAPFPRPPGLSPYQSIESLQRTLVKSAQLAQSWTTRPMRDVSSTEIHVGGRPAGALQELICGRWLVDCESERRFVLHDVNAGAETHAPRVFWEEERPVVSCWDVFSMPSVGGQCVVYVLLGLSSGHTEWSLPQWKLLEFRLNDQSGELYDSIAMDPPASKCLRGTGFDGGRSPFLFIPTSPTGTVFDTRTRVFYEVPEFRVALDETFREIDQSDVRVLFQTMTFTSTYIISIAHLDESLDVMQVFTLPLDGSPVENGNSVLRLTHEAIADPHVAFIIRA